MLFIPQLDKFKDLKTNRDAVPATAKIVLSPYDATEEPETEGDQEQWKNLFAKEYAAKVRDFFFCFLHGLYRRFK